MTRRVGRIYLMTSTQCTVMGMHFSGDENINVEEGRIDCSADDVSN